MIQSPGLSATPTWHLASYPRSGNHLVRTLIEFAAHRPTLGCPGADRDTPIHQRSANARAGLIRICEPDPIAFKSHFANQLQRHDHDYSVDRFLLITRDPVDAISSHLARDLSRRLLIGNRPIRIAVERELNTYLSLLYAYRAYPAGKRLHVSYEALSGAEGPSHHAARALLRAMGLPERELSEVDWLRLREVAASSQSSLGRRGRRVRDRLRRAVAARISRAEVDHFIAHGTWSA